MAARNVTITHVSAGSVFKLATSLAGIGFIVWMLAAVLIYLGLASAGVIDHINSLIGGVGGDQVVDFPLLLSAAALLGLVWVVFVAVVAPLTAIIYNAVADLAGGLGVTMANRPRT
ncbi:hypothetical protein CAPI_00060 [Corynebacterium capitovis DSM 44611]|uniref:DUF3566 domain-containing protein n=1 Tax=Corynebacterium capitovis TaxID=131081 RepID=UPI000369F3AF|nr:DUF3566 domain-containing protein [Corynebacterium capitovis]WKD56602.1 hypothetical protein CAPI_00060 [Corynebacterium capitovis DSM 44611]